MIVSSIYFLIIFFLLRYAKIFKIEELPKWTLPIAFLIKVCIGFLFSYIFIYSVKNSAEPSDAVRFLNESRLLSNVFPISKSDYFSLLSGIGDNARMLHSYMKNSFIWDAGNFTFINDSRNTIRAHSLIHFICFKSEFVHTLLLCFLSLIGIVQLYIAFKPYTLIKPLVLFASILFFPSLLFWSSGILKEPFLILGLGFLARFALKNDVVQKRIFFGCIGFIFLICFKPYILLCLLPSIVFFILYNYIFKKRIYLTLLVILILLIISILSFPQKRQQITEYFSRKQFDQEIIGNGGIQAVDIGKNRFFFFKPHQYKNIEIKNGFVYLKKQTTIIVIPDQATKKPFKKNLTKIGEKWSIHKIFKHSNSYIKTKSIENSFSQLLLNIPEAILNTFFRPFPTDNGSFLIYPAIFETFFLVIFIFISLIFKRNLNPKEIGIVYGLLIFSLLLMVLIGWTTPILGLIVRYRFPAQLAIFIIGAIFIDYDKFLNRFKK